MLLPGSAIPVALSFLLAALLSPALAHAATIVLAIETAPGTWSIFLESDRDLAAVGVGLLRPASGALYEVRTEADGSTTIVFGDGATGRTPPTGGDVRGTYRYGSGDTSDSGDTFFLAAIGDGQTPVYVAPNSVLLFELRGALLGLVLEGARDALGAEPIVDFESRDRVDDVLLVRRPIPEPGAAALVACGLALLARRSRSARPLTSDGPRPIRSGAR